MSIEAPKCSAVLETCWRRGIANPLSPYIGGIYHTGEEGLVLPARSCRDLLELRHLLRGVGGERGIRTLGRVSPTHAFQACSIDHSDISPFRINDLRSCVDQDSADCDKSSNAPEHLQAFQV